MTVEILGKSNVCTGSVFHPSLLQVADYTPPTQPVHHPRWWAIVLCQITRHEFGINVQTFVCLSQSWENFRKLGTNLILYSIFAVIEWKTRDCFTVGIVEFSFKLEPALVKTRWWQPITAGGFCGLLSMKGQCMWDWVQTDSVWWRPSSVACF